MYAFYKNNLPNINTTIIYLNTNDNYNDQDLISMLYKNIEIMEENYSEEYAAEYREMNATQTTFSIDIATIQMFGEERKGISIRSTGISDRGELEYSMNQFSTYLINGEYSMQIVITYDGNEDQLQEIADCLYRIEDDAAIYIGKKRAIQFIIPSGWHQRDFTEGTNRLEAMFVQDGDKLVQFGYTFMDAYGESNGDESGFSRSDLDSSLFSAEDMEVLLGIDAGSGEYTEYGDNMWYIYEHNIGVEDFIYPELSAVTVEKGYIHRFDLTELRSEISVENRQVLIAILESVVSPE